VSEPSVPAPDLWTIRRVLDWTTGHLRKHGSETPRLDAEVLLAHTCGCRRIDLYVNSQQPLTDDQRQQMRELVQRRSHAEPVAYLVGKREFFSLEFEVSCDVLIPRPDTETLVVAAIDFLKGRPEPRAVDVCCGSGCIGIALAHQLSSLKVVSIDISPRAIEVTRRNAERLKVADRVDCHVGDLLAPLKAGVLYSLIAANPPYVRTDELETLSADVRHEPTLALDGGPDGLVPHRRLLEEAPRHLETGGRLLLEISPEQASAVESFAVATRAYRSVAVRKDLSGLARVLIADTVG
jgi:release factor glutamine methyltransferase